MRILEITLKICFAVLALALIITSHTTGIGLWSIMLLSALLGVVLIFNQKAPSYRYPNDYRYITRVFAMRKIEGVLLIAFVIFIVIVYLHK